MQKQTSPFWHPSPYRDEDEFDLQGGDEEGQGEVGGDSLCGVACSNEGTSEDTSGEGGGSAGGEGSNWWRDEAEAGGGLLMLGDDSAESAGVAPADAGSGRAGKRPRYTDG